jgi:2-alkyl-3-oxoalkanoate reductase
MHIFIAGATGVIGRRVVPVLVDQGHQVKAVGRTPAKRAELEHFGARPIEVDLFDREALVSALAGQEIIINLATHIPPASKLFWPGAWNETNRLRQYASANLVAAGLAGGAQRFIQESFGLIYADQGEDWVDEGSPVRLARYNRGVGEAEAAVQRFSQAGGAGVALRFASFYGADAPQMLDMMRFVRRGWAPLPGSANGFVSSVSHDDAAAAVLAALRLPTGIYNVSDDQPVRRREYFDSLAGALGVAPPRLLPAWTAVLMGSLGETLIRSVRLSNHKLRENSDWKPKYPSVRQGWPAVIGKAEAAGEKLEAGG